VLPGKKYSPEEIVRILLRRKWLIVLPFVLGTSIAVVAAGRLPLQYRSETLIMVVPQRIPDSYVKPTDTTRIEDRLPSISEQIQSRSRLERIINDFNLYPEERASGVMEDLVVRMRSNITVRLEGQTQEAFRVTYTSADPKLAQQVTERLASWYIEESLRDRENFSATTNEFLDSELEDAKRRLVEHEKKLEGYRRRYSGQLPSQLETNLQTMQSAQMQLQAVSESINRARERRLLIERQIADLQVLPAAAAVSEVPGAATPGAAPLSTEQQLQAARASLASARRRFTADHPDVRALERTIRELEAKLAEEAASPRPSAVTTLTPAEAARQKRIKDYQAEVEVIDRQIATNQGEQARLQKLLGDYQSRVDAVPSRESELVELMRDYSTLQATYSSLLTKREDSKLAANLQRRQVGEQFKVLDPASLPERPINQMKRLQVLLGGSVGGLGLGLLLIGFLEYRDSSFKTEDDVVRVLSLPVLALVPLMSSDRDKRIRRRRQLLRGTMLALGLILVVSAAAVAFWRLQA
jgi:polysaccharide chain length determinant protein (PEP-CTERM system associated)